MDAGKETLVQFLMTGKLGLLELGLPARDAFEYLGLPQNYDTEQELLEELPKIKSGELKVPSDIFSYYYDNLELDFSAENLNLIAFALEQHVDEEPIQVPPVLDFGLAAYVNQLDRKSFKELVRRYDIKCLEVISTTESVSEKLLTLLLPDSEMNVCFNVENDNDKIDVISKSIWTIESLGAGSIPW